MLRALFFFSLLFLLGFSVNAQADKKVSLIIHYAVDDSDDDLERFVRFDFLNGQLISQKEIFTIDNDKSGPFYWMYNERYIFTSNRTIDEWRPEEEKSFDLKINKFIYRKNVPVSENKKVSEPFISRSPDGKKSINFKTNFMTKNPLIIKVEGEDDIIINEKFSVTVSSKSSVRPSLPLLWIDNETILTQRRNGNLVKVKLDGKITAFPEIPCDEDEYPLFKKTKAGRLIYRCSSKEFLINTENQSFEKIKPSLDFGFSEEYGSDGTIYYFQNQEIGRGGIDASTTEGFLALTLGKKAKHGFYDSSDINTVKVWNRFTNKWQVFEFDGSHLEILGWYIEKD